MKFRSKIVSARTQHHSPSNPRASGDVSIDTLLRESEELRQQNEALCRMLPSKPSDNDVDSSNIGKRKRGRPPRDKSGIQISPSGRKRKEVKRITSDEEDPTTCGK
jgi:hypothetical protein